MATAPTVKAHELRHAWERFLDEVEHSDEETAEAGDVRGPIVDSWRRSFAAGVDPSPQYLAPVVVDLGETALLWEAHPLAKAAPLIRQCLAATAEEAGYLMVVSDATGMILQIEGEARVRMRAAESMNFAEGTLWSEGGAGTNAIGTALAADHAVQVFAAEHFNENVQRWTCSAAPIHDPDTGALLGVIDLTGELNTVHPASLAVAAATAQAVEASLRLAMEEKDGRLRARYGERLRAAGDPRALVTPTGRVIAARDWVGAERIELPPGGGRLVLPTGRPAVAEPAGRSYEAYVVRATGAVTRRGARPLLRLSFLGRERALAETNGRRIELRRRHAEILALLCAHPEGLSAEALCADLHGDGGSPSSVRVEVSRLRKLIGPWIDTDRYSLTCDVETDVRRLEGLLHAGAVREAAEAYIGALLPTSDAPGVVRERDRLEAWLRQAVMTADDPDALWAYLQTPSGDDDLGAWKRVLTQLEVRDPRRSEAASRVGGLRRAYAVA